MARAEFTIDALVYSDTDASNDPQQRDFDYKKTISVSSMTNTQSQYLTLSAAGTTSVDLPAASISWLFIESDQAINIRLNGDVLDNNNVSPSVAGTSDGIFFKRGTVTSLDINVPGVTDANVRIFAGN